MNHSINHENKNGNYEVKILIESNEIKIKVIEKSNTFDEYFVNLTMEELENVNAIFKSFKKDINKCYEFLMKIFQQNKYSILYEKENVRLNLKLNNLNTGEIEDNYINLKKAEENLGQKVEKLISKNVELTQEIQTLKVENKIQIQIINKLENRINELEKKMSILWNEKVNVKNKKEDIISIFSKSNIINSKENAFFIINLFKNSKLSKLHLIYRATENGDSPESFHKYCDKKGPTLTLIKLSDKNILGGYLSKNWEEEISDSYDDNIFYINVTKKKKYTKKNGVITSYEYDKNTGPLFEDLGFGNYGNLLQEGKFTRHLQKLENCDYSKKADEVEIYQVIYK